MYNSTTKSYTLQDASNSYSWIIESLNVADYQTMTDSEINAWIDSLISTAKDYDVVEAETRAENQSYPVYGYTTADVYEDAESWIANKLAEIGGDYANERETVFQYIKNWIAEGALATFSISDGDRVEVGEATIRFQVNVSYNKNTGDEVGVSAYLWDNTDDSDDEFGDNEVELRNIEVTDEAIAAYLADDSNDATIEVSIKQSEIGFALALYREIYMGAE